ncbi:hypothetical protein B0A48_17099 [Cryoendolithus antarcticus]|uniref:BTB domain-containing protein n=1 Tax=Cryoendolithus antarcticus TaxID=1507870 RepID=A0A1V8SBG8_9PEZI|nr:hypothetical protein B0A48_17099 [Cryoendolithus antarcticus]
MDIGDDLNVSRSSSRDEMNVNPLKRKWIEVDYGDLLEVKVGDPSAPRIFKAHRDVIYKKSKFLAAAATESWMEGQQTMIRLTEVDGKISATYVHCIYVKRIFRLIRRINPLKRKCVEQDYTDILEVRVDTPSAPKIFWVHRDAICKTSKFFNAATSERWATADDKSIKLPGEDANVFAKYLHWVYHDEISIEATYLDPTDLVKFYSLADSLDDVAARNRTTDILLDAWLSKVPKQECTWEVFEMTPPTSKLRLLVVHFYLANVSTRWLEQEADNYPPSFFRQLAMEAMRHMRQNVKITTNEIRHGRKKYQEEC